VANTSPRSDEREKKDTEPDAHDVDLLEAGEVTIVPKENLPTPPEPRRIHPRRVLPPVPEGPD
jgi:hypothetical protein